jgi:DNA-binding IclR family transcriptional regulator
MAESPEPMRTPAPPPPSPPPTATDELDGEADMGAGRGPRGIQSIEVGSQLLKALARSGRAMALKDLARAANLTPAKSHPYLVSFGKVGLIEQDPLSGHYGLGPLAMQLGLISLQQIDPVRLVIAELPGLAQRLGNTVSAAVWGATGPVIIRVEDGPTPVRVSMRHGMPASLRTTGTGKVFAAFRERADIEAALAEEGLPGALDEPAFAAELAAIRREGIARVKDELLVGLSALAVPVFDGFGRLVLAIAAIGPSALLDLSADSPQARALSEVGHTLSQRLGHLGEA